MDEALAAVEPVTDAGFGGALKRILRLVGLVALLTGVTLLLVTEMLLIPVAPVVAGLLLLIAPSIVVMLGELARRPAVSASGDTAVRSPWKK